MRTTMKMVDQMVDALNGLLGLEREEFPEPYTVGRYYVQGVSGGGYRVVCVINEAGGITQMTDPGTLRESYTYLSGMVAGVHADRAFVDRTLFSSPRKGTLR